MHETQPSIGEKIATVRHLYILYSLITMIIARKRASVHEAIAIVVVVDVESKPVLRATNTSVTEYKFIMIMLNLVGIKSDTKNMRSHPYTIGRFRLYTCAQSSPTGRQIECNNTTMECKKLCFGPTAHSWIGFQVVLETMICRQIMNHNV